MNVSQIDKLNPKQLQSVESIFFETSSVKEFSSKEAKAKFLEKYLGYYLDFYPDYFYVAIDQEVVVGYICACPDTIKDPYFTNTFLYYKNLDASVLDLYPAHLHINLSSRAQGHGIGSMLLSSLLSALARCDVKGIHIFTTESSRNVGFYRKNEFCDELSVEFDNTSLHFMGKVITSR